MAIVPDSELRKPSLIVLPEVSVQPDAAAPPDLEPHPVKTSAAVIATAVLVMSRDFATGIPFGHAGSAPGRR
jgi:hypothetical protein